MANDMVASAITFLTHPACGRVIRDWQILAVNDEGHSSVILAIRDGGEYVVARMNDPENDTEWCRGFYTRNMETAHWNFRAR